MPIWEITFLLVASALCGAAVAIMLSSRRINQQREADVLENLQLKQQVQSVTDKNGRLQSRVLELEVQVRQLTELLMQRNAITASDYSVVVGATRKTQTRLVTALEIAFSLEELRRLCFDVGVKYDDLEGETISAKAVSLVELCERRDCLDGLLEQMRTARPNLNL
jgi:hypothetical protein